MSEDKKRVLIIDDDRYLLDIYSVKFNEEGYEVDTAAGGQEALEKMDGGDYSVVLLDIVMPSMDGFEVLQKIEEKQFATNTPIIILSNQGQPDDIKKAKNYNVDGYIVKASTVPSEVVNEVAEIANRSSQR